MKDFLSTAILGLVAVAVLVGAWSLSQKPTEFVPKNTAPVAVDLHAVANRILDSKVVGAGANEQVQFAYIGDTLINKLDPEEVQGMRTASSWTKNVTSKSEYDQGAYGLQTIAYSKPTFIKRPDGWHTIEHGTAPKKAFDQAMALPRLFATFIPVAYAAENPQIYSATFGDGYINLNILGGTWASVHNATDGTFALGGTTATFSASVTSGKLGGVIIERAFVPFDTSVISSKATISSATLNIYAQSVSDTTGDGGDYIAVVQTSQPDYLNLTAADYDLCGAVSSPTQGVTSPPTLSSLSLSAYTTMTLNATGLTWIKKNGATSNCSSVATGITCLGLRDGHDAQNGAPASDTGDSLAFYTSDAAGTANDPYLQVTYTVPQAVLNGGVWLAGSGGRLNVVGGGLKVLN